jgi:hypothetical protein
MPFNGYNWSNGSDLGRAIVDAPNTNTGDSFWTAILYFIWIVAMGLLLIFGWEVALLVSSFGAMIIGIFLVYLHAIAWQWLIPFPAIILFTILYIVWSSNR